MISIMWHGRHHHLNQPVLTLDTCTHIRQTDAARRPCLGSGRGGRRWLPNPSCAAPPLAAAAVAAALVGSSGNGRISRIEASAAAGVFRGPAARWGLRGGGRSAGGGGAAAAAAISGIRGGGGGGRPDVPATGIGGGAGGGQASARRPLPALEAAAMVRGKCIAPPPNHPTN